MIPEVPNPEFIREILEANFFPTTLTEESYTRAHDDTDGDEKESITVMIDFCGDVYLFIDNISSCFRQSRRFRTRPGGGQSLRTRNALLLLAEAIRLDNEEDRR